MKKSLSLLAVSLLFVGACASDEENKEENGQQEEVQVASEDQDAKNLSEDVKNDSLSEKIAKFNEYSAKNPFYFAFDSSVVKDNNLVKNYVQLMNAMDKDVKYSINGYCDSRGSVEYNNALGMRRANAVKVSLQNKGVDSKMAIKTVSFGKNKFKNYYTNFAKNQQANRKVEIVAEENK